MGDSSGASLMGKTFRLLASDVGKIAVAILWEDDDGERGEAIVKLGHATQGARGRIKRKKHRKLTP